MTLLDGWMPAYAVSARYTISIDAPAEQVFAALMACDFRRSWVVRGLMGARLLPELLRAPAATWRAWKSRAAHPRPSLGDPESDFVMLEQSPPREVVLGITGRFWTLAADRLRVPPERFRDEIPAGMAQAAWNFAIRERTHGCVLSTETRVRCADEATRRTFLRYWRIVAPGSGLIRHAILAQVKREALHDH